MKLISPMIITGLLLSALPAFAQSTVTAQLPKDGGNVCQNKTSFDSKLQVTPAQREKLGNLRDQFKLSTADKKAELEVAHNQLRRLFAEPIVDKQAALALQTKINGLRDELSNAGLNMMLSSADIFTPAQRAEFAKIHAERSWRHHRGGHESSRGVAFGGHGDHRVG